MTCISAIIAEIILSIKFPYVPDDVTPESSLVEDIDFDELDHVTMAMDIEQRLGIDFTDAQALACETVADVIYAVEALVAINA
jgi:acyl carrier protein